jgi:acetylornithine deacetylase/succinyl-diaminopimelate desuccinylase-like protein
MWKRVCLAVLLVLAAAAPAPSQTPRQGADIAAWRLSRERQIVSDLIELTRLKSVAADAAGLAQTAERLRDELTRRGFAARLLTAAPGAPAIVFGALEAPGATRTVVFYAHYDGQPVTPSEWRSDPFEPVVRDGPGPQSRTVDWRAGSGPLDPEWRLFGRAASDDKASIIAFLAAFDALKAVGRKPTVNIKVVWDGEEERGSPNMEAVLRANTRLMAADLWLIGDASMHASRKPMIYFGARGVQTLEATVYGPARALHDGHYGNWAPNPAAMAAQLIAELRAPDGTIRIPGFLAAVRPLTAAERTAIARLPPVEAELRGQFGVGAAESGDGLTASTMRPALNIRGLRAGQVGAAANNAIPPEATVSIDFRLVPDQTPTGVRQALEAHLKARGWTLVTAEPDAAARAAHPKLIRLEWGEGSPALRSDMSSPEGRAVIEAASRAAGEPVAVLPMMGGSVPIHMFAQVFGKPVIGLPIVNHDNNQHAANENMRLKNLWDGIETYAVMISGLTW